MIYCFLYLMFPNDELFIYLVGRFMRVNRNTMDVFSPEKMELKAIGSWDLKTMEDPSLINIDTAPKFPTTALV